ncbi:MAG: hypothetical protein WDZ88_02065 [Candidatus Paceibacterota bacterium]
MMKTATLTFVLFVALCGYIPAQGSEELLPKEETLLSQVEQLPIGSQENMLAYKTNYVGYLWFFVRYSPPDARTDSSNNYYHEGKWWPHENKITGGIYALNLNGRTPGDIVTEVYEKLVPITDRFIEAAEDPKETAFFVSISFFDKELQGLLFNHQKVFYLEQQGNSWVIPEEAFHADFEKSNTYSVSIKIPGIKHATMQWRTTETGHPFLVEESAHAYVGGGFEVRAFADKILVPAEIFGKAVRENLYGEFIVYYSVDRKLFEQFDLRTGEKITPSDVHLSIEVIDGTARLVARGQCAPGTLTIECSTDLETWEEVATYSGYTGLLAMPLPNDAQNCIFRARTNVEEERVH